MAITKRTLGVPMQFREFGEHSQNSLNSYQANVFDPQHLQGARPELVQLMFKIGWKAAELERTKLQSEIRKEESELRRKTCPDGIKQRHKGWSYEESEEGRR